MAEYTKIVKKTPKSRKRLRHKDVLLLDKIQDFRGIF